MSVGNENNARSSDGRRDNSHWGGTRCDEKRYWEQNSRDRERTLTQDQIRAKEVTTLEGKTTMATVDYVGKKAIEQRTAVIVLLVEVLPTLNENAFGIKGRNKPSVLHYKNRMFQGLNGKMVAGRLDSGSSILLLNGKMVMGRLDSWSSILL